MISTDSVNDSVLGPPAGALELRIRGGSRDGHVIRLQSSKCTLGASGSCSLQFRRQGVHPIHCLILRGRGGAVIRRWSPDTWLNGKLFDDAVLKNGDQLTIGPVEFDVSIEADFQPPILPASPAAAAAPVQPPSQRDDKRDDLEERLRAMQQQLSDSRLTGHRRSRRLISWVRDARKKEEERVEQSEQSQRVDREAFEKEQQELQQQFAKRQKNLAERETIAQERDLRLDNREEAIDYREQAAQESDQMLQVRTNQFNVDVEQHREEQEEQHKQREQQRDQHQLDITKLAEQRLALQQDRDAFETDRSEFEENHTEEKGDAEEKEARFDSTSSEPPMTSADIFSRMGLEMPQEEAHDSGRSSREKLSAPSSFTGDALTEGRKGPPVENLRSGDLPSPSSSPSDRVSSATEEDDESIEDYMARLMIRVRGEVEEAEANAGIAMPRPIASHAGPMPSSSSAHTQTEAESPMEERPEETVPSEPTAPSDAYLPHNSAPEKASNLAAMREIANASARSHITQSTKSHRGQVALVKLAMALIALVAGIALTLWSTHLQSLPFLGACFGYLAAGYWMLQSARLAMNLLKARRSDDSSFSTAKK